MKARHLPFILLILSANYGCNNAADTGVAAQDSTQNASDSGKEIYTPPQVDTAVTRPALVTEKKSAVLGYSYFTHMRQEETRNIYAYIQSVNNGTSIDRQADQVKSILKEANSQVKPERKSDTASYFTTANIYYYKYLTLTLTDPAGNFRIDSLNTPSRQPIDSNATNSWQWAVTPKTSVPSARLMLQVMAETESGQQKPIGTREIAINIQLEMNFWRSLITWLRNNPEKLLVLIIIPLAVYFGRRILDPGKKNPPQP